MGWANENGSVVQEKVGLCAACHGPTGVSTNPIWPNLAGQHALYLKKQLYDLKAGKQRFSDVMAPFVASLSEEDIASLALFYSKQVAPISKTEVINTRGAQLYRGGDSKKQIPACIACHGPSGLGNGYAGFPSVAGQQVDYTISQLQAFKNKARTNDLSAMMQTISARMDENDMKAVAEYMCGLESSKEK